MKFSPNDSSQDAIIAIHQYYMDILNCMPNVVYWVDVNCILKGCNKHFVNLLGLTKINSLDGTPYDQLVQCAGWSASRVDALRLDDMAVIFSGMAKENQSESVIYDKDNKPLYFSATRIPLLDKQKHIIGLVVIWVDDAEKRKLALEKQEKAIHVDLDNVSRVRVLLVEDNPVAQKVELSLLTSIGCQVDIAESGKAAKKLFAPGKYQIVLMDIGLQDTSGYVVAKKIREEEKNTSFHTPIIALTSYEAKVVKDDCSDYDMEGVLKKPLTSEQAEQIVKRFVLKEDINVLGLY